MELQKIQKINTFGLCPGYQADIKRYMQFSGGVFTAAAVQDFFTDMEQRGLKPATMQRHRSALKKALLVNMGQGVTLAEIAQIEQFFKSLKIAKPEQAKQQEDMLSPGELKRLVTVAGPRTALIIRALPDSGACLRTCGNTPGKLQGNTGGRENSCHRERKKGTVLFHAVRYLPGDPRGVPGGNISFRDITRATYITAHSSHSDKTGCSKNRAR